MPKYINQLQEQNELLRNQIMLAKTNLYNFKNHLASAKFQGFQSDGSRKDWISTADALNWLREVEKELSVS